MLANASNDTNNSRLIVSGVPAVVEHQHSTMLKTFLSVNFSKFCTYIVVGGGSGRAGDAKVGGKNQECMER